MEDVTRFPCDAEYFRGCGYVVREREFGTRVYGQMFTIEDRNGTPSIEVRRQPLSDTAKDGGLFPPNACHIRLTNSACYRDNAVAFLRDFLAKHNYSLQKIFRIDIAMDFETFDYGDDPQRFVQRYIAGRYSKVNQANISAHGADTWQTRKWQSLSWGAPKSMVSTKMYLKSLELEQVKDKPYIKWVWYQAGLIDNPVSCTKVNKDGEKYKPSIWRVEFSIKASAKRWYVIENRNHSKKTNVYVPHTLDCYDTKERLLLAFANLAQYYFHFKVYEEDKRKDRCRDKPLFNIKVDDSVYRLTGVPTDNHPTTLQQRLIRLLDKFILQTIGEQDKSDAIRLRESLVSAVTRTTAPIGIDPKAIAVLQQALALQVSKRERGDIVKSKQQVQSLVEKFFDESW